MVIDADAVVPVKLSLEELQGIPRGRGQLTRLRSDIQLTEFSLCEALETPKSLDAPPGVKQSSFFRSNRRERLNRKREKRLVVSELSQAMHLKSMISVALFRKISLFQSFHTIDVDWRRHIFTLSLSLQTFQLVHGSVEIPLNRVLIS